MNYEGLKLKPLFHSEIASSYILQDILNNHKEITKQFIKRFLGFNVDSVDYVAREKSYRGKGSVDLKIRCKLRDEVLDILIEVKVHDYLSATSGQILRYFDAAREENGMNDIHLIYLTQYNESNFPHDDYEVNYSLPGTITEFDRATVELQRKNLYNKQLRHVNWEDFYDFIDQYRNRLTKEEDVMLNLQKQWMQAKCKEDLEDNKVEVGVRSLQYFFDDVNVDLEKDLPGKKTFKNQRTVYVIDVKNLEDGELEKTFEKIKTLAQSDKVVQKVNKVTREETKEGVISFLQDIAQESEDWHLLSFYSKLFQYVDQTDHLLLNGTGRTGFSIKVKIKGKGMISLCTLWCNQKIEFSLMR